MDYVLVVAFSILRNVDLAYFPNSWMNLGHDVWICKDSSIVQHFPQYLRRHASRLEF